MLKKNKEIEYLHSTLIKYKVTTLNSNLLKNVFTFHSD